MSLSPSDSDSECVGAMPRRAAVCWRARGHTNTGPRTSQAMWPSDNLSRLLPASLAQTLPWSKRRKGHVARFSVLLSSLIRSQVSLAQRISRGASVAVCGAAMCHMIDVYQDDRPLRALHLLRVCVVSNDRYFHCACLPQSAADHVDLASLVPCRFR